MSSGATWISEKVRSLENVNDVQDIGDGNIQISLENGTSHKVAIVSQERVETGTIQPLTSDSDTEFILVLPKDAFISGGALAISDLHKIGIGGVGDLYRAVNNEEFRNYVSPKVSFIMRGLNQHKLVKQVSMLNNSSYTVTRDNKSDFRLLALYDYEMTADDVREGVSKFGRPDVIFTGNPNCTFTKMAVSAAESMGVHIYRWSELMSAIWRENLVPKRKN